MEREWHETRPPEQWAFAIRDPEAFAHNLARVIEEAGKAASAYLKPREEGKTPFVSADSIDEVVKTLAKVAEYWMAEPERAVRAEPAVRRLHRPLGAIAAAHDGRAVPPAVAADPRDRRFTDPEWSQNQFFDFIKQLYLITARWAGEMVDEAADARPAHPAEGRLLCPQITNALAPSNFVFTNPELLRETLPPTPRTWCAACTCSPRTSRPDAAN